MTPDTSPPRLWTPYEPDRSRQLRILLYVVAAAAATMLALAGYLLLAPGRVVDTSQVLLVLALPGALLVLGASSSLWLLAVQSAAARLTTPATGLTTVAVGLLLSRTGPGLLVGLVGIMLLLISVLPGREADA